VAIFNNGLAEFFYFWRVAEKLAIQFEVGNLMAIISPVQIVLI